jgi:hypothetical protein
MFPLVVCRVLLLSKAVLLCVRFICGKGKIQQLLLYLSLITGDHLARNHTYVAGYLWRQRSTSPWGCPPVATVILSRSSLATYSYTRHRMCSLLGQASHRDREPLMCSLKTFSFFFHTIYISLICLLMRLCMGRVITFDSRDTHLNLPPSFITLYHSHKHTVLPARISP